MKRTVTVIVLCMVLATASIGLLNVRNLSLRLLLENGNRDAVLEALHAVANEFDSSRPAWWAIEPALGMDDPEIRFTSARLLLDIDKTEDRATMVLLKGLTHTDPQVRSLAIVHSGGLADKGIYLDSLLSGTLILGETDDEKASALIVLSSMVSAGNARHEILEISGQMTTNVLLRAGIARAMERNKQNAVGEPRGQPLEERRVLP